MKTYPQQCLICTKRDVYYGTFPYIAQVRHDDCIHIIIIKDLSGPVCISCGARIFTIDVDEQINRALRSKLHLLSPEYIRERLVKIGITEEELALCLNVLRKAVTSWLNGCTIQSRRMDNLLRIHLEDPNLRRRLFYDGPYFRNQHNITPI